MPATLAELLSNALDARSTLCAKLAEENTDAYRLFDGDTEGRPGLSVDRLGELVLVQTFDAPLDAEEEEGIARLYRERLQLDAVVYNAFSARHPGAGNALSGEQLAQAELPRVVHEMGVKYMVQGRHEDRAPQLPLAMRAARRRLMALAPGKTVLSLFAHTCSVGVVAARAGAEFVLNVDASEAAIKVGRSNAKLNALPHRPRFMVSDLFAAMRQFAGIGQPRFVRGKRMPKFPEVEARQFDLVFLDPPRYAKSLFGVVDVVNDYSALFKPALLATAEGGTLICSNSAPEVDAEAWLAQLQRSALKAGREVREARWIEPEADFPAADGQPALKIVELSV